MYNLMSKSNMRLVKEIYEMGHKISLHFDPTAYSDLDPFINEKNFFESQNFNAPGFCIGW